MDPLKYTRARRRTPRPPFRRARRTFRQPYTVTALDAPASVTISVKPTISVSISLRTS